MDFHRNLGTNVSMIFLLALTIIAAGIFYIARGAEEKIQSDTNTALIQSLLL